MKRPFVIVVAACVLLGVGGLAYWFGLSRGREARAPASMAGSAMPSPAASGTAKQGRKVLYWYDPMKPEQHFDKPGKSPFMDMRLVPKYAEQGEETSASAPSISPKTCASPLYWYDPMKPEQHFDKPGKSPFMNMQLVPRCRESASGAGVVRVDPAVVQNLGMRTEEVRLGHLGRSLRVPATLAWDRRESSSVSARVNAIVDRLYVRAPYDEVRKGQPLAALLAPEWSAAIAEYRALADADSEAGRALRATARERLRALGISDAELENFQGDDPHVVLRAPADGVVSELAVREGERVNAGMPILQINGLDHVWVEAAVPQADMSGVASGTPVSVTVSALPGERFGGHVEAVLPDVDPKTRTQTVRIVLDNPQHHLAPGMFAEVSIAATEGEAHPLVPEGALISTGDDARVVLATDDGFRVVRVRVGRSGNGMTEVLAGLAGGERVVTSGQFLIDSEASLSGALQRLGTGDGQSAGDNQSAGDAQGAGEVQ